MIDGTPPRASASRPWTLRAGRALDEAVFRTLLDRHEPQVLRERRIRPWSRHAGLTCNLIWVLTSSFGLEDGRVSVTCTSHVNVWTCTIDAPTWYCEAEGCTLPEAFCRALVQEEGMDLMEDDPGTC